MVLTFLLLLYSDPSEYVQYCAHVFLYLGSSSVVSSGESVQLFSRMQTTPFKVSYDEFSKTT
jgi:hypothetical protein